MTSGGFGIPGLGMLLFWGLLIFVVVLLIKSFSRDDAETSGSTARAMLDQRFARGEIEREEYEDKKEVLK